MVISPSKKVTRLALANMLRLYTLPPDNRRVLACGHGLTAYIGSSWRAKIHCSETEPATQLRPQPSGAVGAAIHPDETQTAAAACRHRADRGACATTRRKERQ